MEACRQSVLIWGIKIFLFWALCLISLKIYEQTNRTLSLAPQLLALIPALWIGHVTYLILLSLHGHVGRFWIFVVLEDPIMTQLAAKLTC